MDFRFLPVSIQDWIYIFVKIERNGKTYPYLMWFLEAGKALHYPQSEVEPFFDGHEKYLQKHDVEGCNANLNTVACWGSKSFVVFILEDDKWKNYKQDQVR